MSNKIWLQAAIERLSNANTDWSKYDKLQDQKNVAHAQKTWEIQRDGSWYIVYKDPTKNNIDLERVISWSKLDDWKNSTKMLEDLEKMIKRKEEILQPTTEEEVMWRGMIKDTTPFGAVRDNVFYETVPTQGSFQNENLRQLSPSDQASIRASRDAAAQAHLSWIASERAYIWENAASVLQSLSSSINEKMKLEAAKIKAASSWNDWFFTNTDIKNLQLWLWWLFTVDELRWMDNDSISDLRAIANSSPVKALQKIWLNNSEYRSLLNNYISDDSWNAETNLAWAIEIIKPWQWERFTNIIMDLESEGSWDGIMDIYNKKILSEE